MNTKKQVNAPKSVEADTAKKQNVSKGGIKLTDTDVKQAVRAIDTKIVSMLNASVNTSKGSAFNDETTITIDISSKADPRLSAMLNSLPKQVRILLLNGVINTFDGHATARQLQDWFVKSDFYCPQGTGGRYKQDVLNEGPNDSKDFVSTYFTTEGLKISRKGFTPTDYSEVIVVR